MILIIVAKIFAFIILESVIIEKIYVVTIKLWVNRFYHFKFIMILHTVIAAIESK